MVKCVDRFFRWLDPIGEKIEVKFIVEEEGWVSVVSGPEVPALWAEFPGGGNSGLRAEVPAPERNRLSPFGIPLWRGPGTSPRKFPRKFPVGRKFRPTAGSSGPWKFRVKKRLSHIWDPSLEGSRNFPPEVPPGHFRWGRKFRPPGRKFWPVEISGGNMAKSFLGSLSGGALEL